MVNRGGIHGSAEASSRAGDGEELVSTGVDLVDHVVIGVDLQAHFSSAQLDPNSVGDGAIEVVRLEDDLLVAETEPASSNSNSGSRRLKR